MKFYKNYILIYIYIYIYIYVYVYVYVYIYIYIVSFSHWRAVPVLCCAMPMPLGRQAAEAASCPGRYVPCHCGHRTGTFSIFESLEKQTGPCRWQ